MLICHHGHQPVIYATWAQTNSQIIFLFLSLNEKETKVLNVMRIRCAGGVCVNQWGLDLHAAKIGAGGTHLTWWTMTLQSSWCFHHIVWWWGYDGIYYWLSIKNQTLWDWGCLLWAEHFRCALPPYFHSFYCHCYLGIPQNQLWLSTGTCSVPFKCKEKYNILDHSKIALC